MQIIFLDPVQTILLDILAWTVIQLTIGYLSSRIPLDRLDYNQWFFQTFKWEQNGEIYEKLFHVRSWKHLIPNGSALYPNTFSTKNLPTRDPGYLDRWLKESVRSEICHWMMILPCIFFFLWNNETMGWVNVAYAILSNLPLIILQRYNRPRMRRLLAQQEKKTVKKDSSYTPKQELSKQELTHSYP